MQLLYKSAWPADGLQIGLYGLQKHDLPSLICTQVCIKNPLCTTVANFSAGEKGKIAEEKLEGDYSLNGVLYSCGAADTKIDRLNVYLEMLILHEIGCIQPKSRGSRRFCHPSFCCRISVHNVE